MNTIQERKRKSLTEMKNNTKKRKDRKKNVEQTVITEKNDKCGMWNNNYEDVKIA